MAKVTVTECECLKCGYKWLPRQARRPSECPRCKNPKWWEPKRIPKWAQKDKK